MMLISKKTTEIIEKYMPDVVKHQVGEVSKAEPRFRFGDMFTSSISNYNISANYHRDTGNLKGSVNAIYTKRWMSTGGSLHVPEFGICVEQADESLLVYPAWKSTHGVTPIERKQANGYRNSFVLYPLKAFLPKKEN